MTTLVTGGTGFLGRHIVDRLLERGERVRVLTRRVDLELADKGVELIEGSITESSDIRRAVDGVTHVYHLAGRVERDPDQAHLMYELHVEGTRRLLDALREQPVERIVYASTSGTVGVSRDPDFMATDDSPTVENVVRRWPYYLSKIYAERVVERFVAKHDMPIVTMRPSLLLGPGDRQGSSTGDVVLFLQKKIPTSPSGGLSFVDVRDVADAFLLAMERGTPGRTYLLGADNVPFEDYFKRLEHLTGIRAPWVPLPDKTALMGARLLDGAMRALGRKPAVDPVSVDMARHFWYVTSERARQELGWTPRPSGETLRDTIKWIQTNHHEFAHLTDYREPPASFVPSETVEFARKLREG